MILIEIRGEVFNPQHITQIDAASDGNDCRVWFTNMEDYIRFADVTPNTLAAEINNAIYDHEYFLEQKRIEARSHFTNPLEK